MRGKLARIAACAVAAVSTGIWGLVPAQAARASSDIVTVPCSVHALVLAMNNISSGEVLSLASNCTYLLTQGLPVVSEDLTISGNGATLQRSYAPGTPAFVILTSDAASLTVSRLSFRNGDGGIAMDHGGELTVNGGTFTGNTSADGGAISQPSAGGNGPVVSNATFVDNRATDSGGAIGDAAAFEGVQITNCTFSGNEAANFGGAISDFSSGEYVDGSVFIGNRALNGGAVFLDPNGGADMSHDVLEGNSATDDGGAVYSQYGLGIDNSKFSDNHAGGQGGGLYIDVIAYEDTVASTDFTGNSATDGGAIGNIGETGLDLTDVAISGNHASEYGAGIYNESYFEAVGTQITGNDAVSGGGGIYNVEDEDFTTPTLTNSSVVANKPDNCEPLGSVPGCTG
jgi:hypothetical protein